MATYTKKLKTLNVHLMLDSEVVNIADTVDNDMATRALNEFKKYGSMHYETESEGQKVTNAIPYHAVQYIEVTEADGSVDKADPYGCDEGGSDTGEVWYTATVPSEECNQSVYQIAMASTPNARTSELVANSNAYDVSVNGVAMSFAMVVEAGGVVFTDNNADDFTVGLEIAESMQVLDLKCPPRFEAGTNVEVTVVHK